MPNPQPKGALMPTEDRQHLRLLSIFHYIVAGLAALFACIPFIHFFIGLAMVAGWMEGADPMARGFGIFFMILSAVFILSGWAFAVCLALAGRFLGQYRRHTYCLVMAAVGCIFIPFGTVLGIFTIMVLMRDSVKTLFERSGGLRQAAEAMPVQPASEAEDA
jgi:hypothetical protein